MADPPLAQTVPSAPTPPDDALPATIDRFVIRGRLGRGGMGDVLAGFDPVLERAVAVKRMRGAATAAATRALLAEARAQARIEHPNVVAVYDAGVANGEAWIAMELVDGETLREAAARPRSRDEWLRLIADAGRGLAAAHAAGLVHRDIKPENVLCGRDGRVRVADFGLAAALDASGGTPGYQAPEQLGGAPADARSDQFALAVVAWEVLTGAHPFAAATVDEQRARMGAGELSARGGLSPALARVLTRALAPEPAARFPDVRAFVAALPASPPAPRSPSLVIVGAAAVVALAAAGAWFATRPSGVRACAVEAEALTAAWTPSRRASLVVALGDRGAPLASRIDAQVASWSRALADGCADGRSITCLTDGAARLRAYLEQLAVRGSAAAELASPALAALPGPASCAGIAAAPIDDRLAAPLARLSAAVARVTLGECEDGLRELRALAPTLGETAGAGRHAEALAVAAATCGTPAELRDALGRARAVAAAAHDDIGQATAWLAWIEHVVADAGELAEAQTSLELAADMVGRAGSPPALEGRLAFVRALVARANGDLPAAEAWLRRQLEVGAPTPLARLEHLANLGAVREERGDPRGAIAVLQPAEAAAREVLGPRHRVTGHVAQNLCSAQFRVGNLRSAFAACNRALDALDVAGSPPRRAADVLAITAEIATAAGEPARGLTFADRALERATQGQIVEAMARAQAVRGNALVELGRAEDAEDAYQAALAAQPAYDPYGRASVAHHGLGRLAIAARRPRDAIAHFAAAATVLEAAPVVPPADRIAALTGLGLAHDGAGEPDEGAIAYRRAIDVAGGDAARAPGAATELASYLLERGRPDEAIPLLEAARTHQRDRNRAVATITLAQAVAPADRARAATLFDEALDLFRDHGAPGEADRARALRRSVLGGP